MVDIFQCKEICRGRHEDVLKSPFKEGLITIAAVRVSMEQLSVPSENSSPAKSHLTKVLPFRGKLTSNNGWR